MTKENHIYVIGSGGHSKVVIDILESMNRYTIIGIVDPFRKPNEIIHGYTVLGDETILKKENNQYKRGIVAIGDNWIRSQWVLKVKSICPSFEYITAIHPYSFISKDSKVGKGSVIMAGAIVNSNSVVGEHCIVNTNSSIDHDNSLGYCASIAPGVTTGGNVKIGDYSAISIGATMKHGIEIGAHTIIGAGSTVLSNIESSKVAYGTPAKVIRDRKKGDKYL
ncbi:acetyltransferase [Halalkalibacter kiskunsagensis]|uniref:Acetyltransferase n=1 Tax=Halalkalibacter kiskunsagensis TaxID=1548599 RepID=A0ABV6K9R4_9BACI